MVPSAAVYLSQWVPLCVMAGVPAEFVCVKAEPDQEHTADNRIVLLLEPKIERVKEEPCEEPWGSDSGCEGPGHYEQDMAGLVPDHGQSILVKVKVEKEEVKDESVCKEEPPGSDTGPCSPGPYSAQAELAPELYIETQHRVANQTGFTKSDPLQKCEVQHKSISDQNQSPESQAQNSADQRMAVAGTPQDIDEVFECETCGKTFNKIFYFTSHMQLHEYNLKIVETKTKTYSCDTCGKQFETKKLLREHELTHVTRDYREYSCQFCGKTFSYMYQLTSHTRVHAGEKPYKCTMCARRFAWTSSLACHERSHIGQKPDVSNVCDKGFGYYRMDDHRLPKAVDNRSIRVGSGWAPAQQGRTASEGLRQRP